MFTNASSLGHTNTGAVIRFQNLDASQRGIVFQACGFALTSVTVLDPSGKQHRDITVSKWNGVEAAQEKATNFARIALRVWALNASFKALAKAIAKYDDLNSKYEASPSPTKLQRAKCAEIAALSAKAVMREFPIAPDGAI